MESIGSGRVVRTRVFAAAQCIALALAAYVAACSDDSSSRIAAPVSPSFAKGGGTTDPVVQSASPSYAHRDTTLDVHVKGSGFSAGAKATWSLGGDTTLVHVNRTTFVSSGEVVANVTVPAGAPLASYDITVMLLGGKKGVGSELFEVTTAEVLLAANRVVDINDLGGIVGGTDSAFYYDDACGAVNLGAAEGWGLDPQGAVVSGRTHAPAEDFLAVVWIRTGACSFTKQLLPNPGGGGGFAKSIARDASGTILVGGTDVTAGRRGVGRPVVWTRSGTTWLAPVFYTTPDGTGEIWRINGKGMAVGRGSQGGYLWDSPSTLTIVDGLPFGINDGGTIAVGFNNAGLDVYWTRNPSTGQWDPVGHTLPGLSGVASGTAFDVNDVGIVAGRHAVGSKVRGSIWRLDLSVYPPVPIGGVTMLPGIGPSSPSETSSGKAITNVLIGEYYIVSGMASDVSTTNAVRWKIQP